MTGLFVTGTDTGVGKTVVAALLAQNWPQAHYWKPIQCGVDPSTDRADVARFAGLPPDRLLPEAFRLALPQSPHVAARAEGIVITRSRLLPPPTALGPIVAEGAGGVLVPINAGQTMLDLIAWLAWPVAVVARTQLGTINHSLLTLAALRRRGLHIAALVLNGEPVATTTATLRARAGAARVFELPPLPRLEPAALRAAWAAHLREFPLA
jgi:dethiobiotin synthetase